MENKNTAENNQLQLEWLLLNLIKEMKSISSRGSSSTYQNSLEFAKEIIPQVFNKKSILVNSQEPDLARQYRQLAKAESLDSGKKVNPLDLIDARIKKLKSLIKKSPVENDLLRRDLSKHERIRPLFVLKPITEDFVLHKDLYAERYSFEPLKISGVKYTDHKITEDRILRVRLIHPDKAEHSLGADLIYEHYWQEKELVRFAHLQYKIWDGKTLLFSKSPNLNSQLEKLKEALCGKGYCNAVHSLFKEEGKEYRFPYCSAFLRPTDKLQNKNSPLVSSGLHLPICKIGEHASYTEPGHNKKLEHAHIKDSSLTSVIFEDLFNDNKIGSRWLTYEEAEKIYKKHKILESDERIILHAQEFEI